MWPPATEVVVALVSLVGVLFSSTMGYLGTRRANARAERARQRADQAEQKASELTESVQIPVNEIAQAVYRLEGCLRNLTDNVQAGFAEIREEMQELREWQIQIGRAHV